MIKLLLLLALSNSKIFQLVILNIINNTFKGVIIRCQFLFWCQLSITPLLPCQPLTFKTAWMFFISRYGWTMQTDTNEQIRGCYANFAQFFQHAIFPNSSKHIRNLSLLSQSHVFRTNKRLSVIFHSTGSNRRLRSGAAAPAPLFFVPEVWLFGVLCPPRQMRHDPPWMGCDEEAR